MPKFYNIKETEDQATIYLYGPVGWDNTWWGDGTNNEAWALVKALKDLDKEGRKVHIHLNSPGGDIAAGLAIFNTIRSMKAEVHTHNDGLVASMATIIFLAGTHRHSPKTSILHFHRASTGLWGNVNAFEEAIDGLKKFEDSLLEAIISVVPSMSKDDVFAKWFDGKEHFETATDMATLGVVTQLNDEKANIPLRDMSNFANVVKAYQEQPEKTTSFFRLPNILNFSTKTNKEMRTYSLKNLQFQLLIQAFSLPENEDGTVNLTKDQVEKIQAAIADLDAKTAKISELEKANAELVTRTEAAEKEKAELTAKLAGKPGANATPQNALDNQKPEAPENLYTDPINSIVLE